MSGDPKLDLLIVCLTFGIVGLYFIGSPCLIYRSHRFKTCPTLNRFSLEGNPPPGQAGCFFAEQDRQLASLGFVRRDCLSLADAVPNVRALLVLYCNLKSNDLALVTTLYGLDPNTQAVTMQSSYVEIVSQFQQAPLDLLQTNNAQMLGSFPESPASRTYRFPHVHDVHRLFELHQRLLERDLPRAQKILRLDDEFAGDGIAYFNNMFHETYDRQIETGYLFLDQTDQTQEQYRPTIKGAVLMTWRELWPIKQILWNGARAKAMRLEREIT